MNVLNETLNTISNKDLVVVIICRGHDHKDVLNTIAKNPEVKSNVKNGLGNHYQIDDSATAWLNEMLDFDRF